MHSLSIHWFRRDLRLQDNPALHSAVRESSAVLPVYVLSDWQREHAWTGGARQQFLCGCLAALDQDLQKIGSRLVIRQGDAVVELEKLLQESKAVALYTNRSPDPYGKKQEERLERLCQRLGIAFHTYKEAVLHEGAETVKDDGEPYRVFTPFFKNWSHLDKDRPLPRVTTLGQSPPLGSLPLPTLATWSLCQKEVTLPEPGERAAHQRMSRFLEDGRLLKYEQQRDIPYGLTTSALSADLRHGLVGIRELYHHITAAGSASSITTYVKELAWREFYMAVLHFWPDVLDREFNPAFRNLPWESEEGHFQAWKEGRTGFPIVDAGMRQLLATGWMHNRVRMIVSMFLTKDLHVHWRLGESFFMQHLIDGEIASNNGGWQWSAGTGADAAPYFRIQNPWTQTKNYDPEGLYIKQWVPELRLVDPKRFWKAPAHTLAKGYPLPIVDHDTERRETLARFAKARQG